MSTKETATTTTSKAAVEPPKPGEWNPTSTEDFLDATIFQQLLDMDDDDEREFSKGIVWNYFDQVKGSFAPIEGGMFVPMVMRLTYASEKRDFNALSSLGHFLKGSSAAVGLVKLKASCEKIQNYGNKLDETGNTSIPGDEALTKIAEVLVVTKKDFKDAEIWLKRFYGENPEAKDDVAAATASET
jgi:osomolarity two-component system phosphorelay intermediate protein YPD1